MKKLGSIILSALFVLGCQAAATTAKRTKSKSIGTAEKLGKIDDAGRCDAEGRTESLVDLNQDGVMDVRKVYVQKGEEQVLMCRETDLNFDGKKDLFLFYDEDGLIIREEDDLDFSGGVDIISTYEKGKISKQELDTNSDRIIDRILYLENEVPIRLEGDINGDRIIDYWEYYEDGKLIRIGIDEDNDGKADKWFRDNEPVTAPKAEDKKSQEDEIEGKDESPKEDKPQK